MAAVQKGVFVTLNCPVGVNVMFINACLSLRDELNILPMASDNDFTGNGWTAFRMHFRPEVKFSAAALQGK